MRHPTRRYGNPNELAYYAAAYPESERVRRLADELHRDERTVRDWLSGRKKIPFWVPELVRLRRMERDEMLRQMNLRAPRASLVPVTPAGVLEHRPMELEKKPQVVSEPEVSFSLRRSG